jgi:hypothetical protein
VSDIEQLLPYFKESVEREIRDFAREMRAGFAQLNAKFDAQDARLDRVLAELIEEQNKLKR